MYNLTTDLPKHDGSSYHIVFDNLFTSPHLLRLLTDKGMAATGTLRPTMLRELHSEAWRLSKRNHVGPIMS